MHKNTQEPKDSLFILWEKDKAPWKQTKLVSLYDMLRFFAHDFITAAGQLSALTGAEDQDNNEPVEEDVKKLVIIALERLAEMCKKVGPGMRTSQRQAERMASKLFHAPNLETAKHPSHVYRWRHLKEECRVLYVRIYDELNMEMFLHLNTLEVNRYRQRYPFGKSVALKWDGGLATDIQEANKCFVVRRYTASVFHAMRVIERIVQLIAHAYEIKPFDKGVEIPIEEATWDKLLTLLTNHLGKHARSGESAKDSRTREICVSLDSIRGIWRNPVAHPRHHYTKTQASSIFSLTKEVVNQCATLI